MDIAELIIETVNFEEQIFFYKEILNFKLLKKTDCSASFQIGESILSFKENKKASPYHFAFNIPFNKVEEALAWLKSRVDVIPYEDNDIIDFINWKAKAIYFYDHNKNIVEFIARREIGHENELEFNSESIINISEIGIGTNNIKSIYDQLNGINPIDVFDGDFNRFCALGDNNGLFIVVDILKKDWFPTGDRINPSEFIVKGDYNFEYREGKLRELV